jgi:hypothetical protein
VANRELEARGVPRQRRDVTESIPDIRTDLNRSRTQYPLFSLRHAFKHA